jgi:hypothetical protein
MFYTHNDNFIAVQFHLKLHTIHNLIVVPYDLWQIQAYGITDFDCLGFDFDHL